MPTVVADFNLLPVEIYHLLFQLLKEDAFNLRLANKRLAKSFVSEENPYWKERLKRFYPDSALVRSSYRKLNAVFLVANPQEGIKEYFDRIKPRIKEMFFKELIQKLRNELKITPEVLEKSFIGQLKNFFRNTAEDRVFHIVHVAGILDTLSIDCRLMQSKEDISKLRNRIEKYLEELSRSPWTLAAERLKKCLTHIDVLSKKYPELEQDDSSIIEVRQKAAESAVHDTWQETLQKKDPSRAKLMMLTYEYQELSAELQKLEEERKQAEKSGSEEARVLTGAGWVNKRVPVTSQVHKFKEANNKIFSVNERLSMFYQTTNAQYQQATVCKYPTLKEQFKELKNLDSQAYHEVLVSKFSPF